MNINYLVICTDVNNENRSSVQVQLNSLDLSFGRYFTGIDVHSPILLKKTFHKKPV